MRKINPRNDLTLYISEVTLREHEKNLRGEGLEIDRLSSTDKETLKKLSGGNYEWNPGNMVFGMINEAQREYLHIYSQLTGINNLAVLDAHGDSKDGKWIFTDEENQPSRDIQRWIQLHEKNHHAIALGVCNPGEHEVTSNKSILIYPITDLTLNLFGEVHPFEKQGPKGLGANIFQFYVPKIGFVDDYTIDYELTQLREKLAERKQMV